MKVDRRHTVDRSGVALVQNLTVRDLEWLFREQPVSDFGVDAQVEIVERGFALGRLLALQIKSGKSYFQERAGNAFVYRGDRHHLRYWLGYALPVIVVIGRPESQEAYWQVVAEDTIVRTEDGWKMTIPVVNRYGEVTRSALQALCSKRIAELGRDSSATRVATQDLSLDLQSFLPLLVPNPAVLDVERLGQEFRSGLVQCQPIASIPGLLALLTTDNSPEGRVIVFRRCSHGWKPTAHFKITTKYSEWLPAFFVLGQGSDCLVITHPTGWGTGNYLEEERWYLLSNGVRVVLQYPSYGHVTGWDLLLDREIEGHAVIVPGELADGAGVEVLTRTDYTLPRPGDQEGMRLFELERSIRVSWDQASMGFVEASGTDFAPADALGLYEDGHEEFAARNLPALLRLARQASNEQRTFLTELAQRVGPNEKEALLRVIPERSD